MLIEFASLVLMHTRGPKLLITSTEPLGEVACGHAQKVRPSVAVDTDSLLLPG